MDGAEFKVLRESLGLSNAWLAARWGLGTERAIRRWEDNVTPVPDQRADQLQELADHAEQLVDEMLDDLDATGEDVPVEDWPTVEVPRVDADCARTGLPAAFFRAIAVRVWWELGGQVRIRYGATEK